MELIQISGLLEEAMVHSPTLLINTYPCLKLH